MSCWFRMIEKSVLPGSSVSAQKPFYLILSSLQNCSDQNSCLAELILLIFRYRSTDSKNLRPCEIASSQKSCSLVDENVFKFSFCTEFLDARAATITIYTVLSLFCGR